MDELGIYGMAMRRLVGIVVYEGAVMLRAEGEVLLIIIGEVEVSPDGPHLCPFRYFIRWLSEPKQEKLKRLEDLFERLNDETL